jgi:hypothetical protein
VAAAFELRKSTLWPPVAFLKSTYPHTDTFMHSKLMGLVASIVLFSNTRFIFLISAIHSYQHSAIPFRPWSNVYVLQCDIPASAQRDKNQQCKQGHNPSVFIFMQIQFVRSLAQTKCSARWERQNLEKNLL